MFTGLRNTPLFVTLIGIAGLAMFVPAIHAFSRSDYDVSRPFLYTGTMLMFVVVLLVLAMGANKRGNRDRSHLLSIVGMFTVLPIILAIPFREALPSTNLFNSWWEMVSALTTTGGSLYDPARLAPSLHLWRAIVGWMGGYFMLVMAIAVLAPLRLGGFEVFFSGGPDGVADSAAFGINRRANVASAERIADYAAQLLPIYLALTFTLWIGLLICGDGALTAVIYAMSVISTSGISPNNGLAASGSGIWGEILIFLFLFPALSRRFWPGAKELRATQKLSRDPELRLALFLVFLVMAGLFIRHWIGAFEVHTETAFFPIISSLWGTMFTALSFLTTTGFESAFWEDARSWSGLGTPGLILAGLAVTGGGIATTAGGVRLLRVYALIRHGERELDRLVHPASVGGGGASARKLRRQGAFAAWIFFMLFAISIAVIITTISFYGLDFEPATIFTVSALSNTGPLTAIAGDFPLDWGALSTPVKTILAVAMILGRIETLAIIALFNPEFWRA
ncbi:hypothetical protein BFP70_12880 [Thioclava sp. SK-1]|uniref:TrkH family potassium uptake protein n=1 Tax=Thioclava sp. SK-1 TaxID=1889770 RepID=UPI0008257EFC|nr:potassium transporter TrkG [Thioclava sp. SK-1]OCX63103.1 hypothetical protein BFP70_12880 [Thioclava sp. SK-1]